MKRIFFIGLIAIVGIYFYAQSNVQAVDEKFAFLNVAKVFDEYQKTKDNDSVLQKAAEKKEQERNVIVDDIRKMKDELELLGDEAKKQKQEAINKRVQELQEFDLQARQQLGEQRQQIVQEIFTDIDEVVQQYGKEKGFSFILNDKALVYQNEKLDITDPILKKLNENFSKKK